MMILSALIVPTLLSANRGSDGGRQQAHEFVRDSSTEICVSVFDSSSGSSAVIFLRLDAEGLVAEGAAPPATPPNRMWSWRRVGDSARVSFRGIDSGESFSFALDGAVRRVSRQLWWANNGGGRAVDSVEVRAVACPALQRKRSH